MYKLLKTENNARLGEFHTNRGVVKTPAFMNVATCGAIKGALSALDLKDIKCQVQLCNTYHLHVRPGDKLVKEMGKDKKSSGGTIHLVVPRTIGRCEVRQVEKEQLAALFMA